MNSIYDSPRYQWEQGLLENYREKMGLATRRDVYNDMINRFHKMNYQDAEFTAWVDTVVDEPWRSVNKPRLHEAK